MLWSSEPLAASDKTTRDRVVVWWILVVGISAWYAVTGAIGGGDVLLNQRCKYSY